MFVTGSFKRNPGYTNIKMCLASLVASAYAKNVHVKWPSLSKWGAHSNTRNKHEFISVHDIFDMEQTERNMGKRLPKWTRHKKCVGNTDDMWKLVNKYSTTENYELFMKCVAPSMSVLELADDVRNFTIQRELYSVSRLLTTPLQKITYGTIHVRDEIDWLAYSKRRAKVNYCTPNDILDFFLALCGRESSGDTDTPIINLDCVDAIILVGKNVLCLCPKWSADIQKSVVCKNLCASYDKFSQRGYTYMSAVDFELAKTSVWFVGHAYSSFSIEVSRFVKNAYMYG